MQGGEVVAYDSRRLRTREEKYPTHDLESAVIVIALKVRQHRLMTFALKCLVIIRY